MKSNRAASSHNRILSVCFFLQPGSFYSFPWIKNVRAEDMKLHLKFPGALEFRGRHTPAANLDIASKYIALTAERRRIYNMKVLWR